MALTTKAWSVAAAEEAFCGWQRRVDEICDRFEDSWGTSTSPCIEAYLASCDFPPARQGALLCELLKLERELRQRQGDQAEIADYLARFPEHANVVRAVFGEIHLGTYEVISLIGEGGMGSVYRAYDGAMRRTVALKVIRSNRLDDSSAQTRFRLEAQLAARLDHESIVPVYEAGQEDGQLFYTMRYIQGRNLAEVIGGQPLECRRAARYIEQVALAVDHAHDHGILHRDVKPSNILIDDATDRAFVTDFGLAKMLDQGTGATQSTDRLGTLAYMAPEQARNPARVGVESDVYSLGATFYEAITGGPPFQADSVLTALELLERQEPTPPRKRNTRVPRDLETICLKCLHKEPHRRYSSAKTLAEDLARFRNGQPIAARRVGPIERTRLWARRNPTITALGLVTILLLGAVFAVFQARTYNAKLEAALTASDLGYKKALASVEEIALFAERRLSDRPAEFKELLKIVLAEYGDYLARRKSDARFSRELAMVLTRVARIMKLFGSSADALVRHEEARAIRQSLSLALPDDLTLKAELAETWHDIGMLLASLGRSTEAIAAYRRSLAIREYLVSRNPGNRTYSNDLARSHGYIGDWERDHGALQKAKFSYDEALRIRKNLSQANPSDLAAKFQLARSYNNNGFLERETGGSEKSTARDRQLEKSLHWHDQAIQLQTELVKLVDQNPLAQSQLDADKKTVIKTADFRSDLAASYHARGVVNEELGRDAVAQADYENALKRLTPLVKEHSGRNEYRGNLASTRTSLAALKGMEDEAAAAEAAFHGLLSVEPNVTRYLAGAARSKAVRGRLLLRSPARRAEGIELLKAALEEQQHLVREHPGNFDYKREEQRIRQALSP